MLLMLIFNRRAHTGSAAMSTMSRKDDDFMKDPRFRAFLREDRIKVLRSLIKIQEQGQLPYLSLIAKQSKMSKRSTLLALEALKRFGIIKSERWEKMEVRGRPTLVRVFELDNGIGDKAKEFISKCQSLFL